MADAPRPRRVRRALSGKLERLIDRAMSPRVHALEQRLARITDSSRVDALEQQIARFEEEVANVRTIAAAAFDGIPRLRHRLLEARSTDEYERAFTDSQPLVTVRISTYNRSKLLVERALPSVMGQTYQNFEVIVVGDGCTDDTAARVEAFGDPRVRFVNMPFRFPYPSDPVDRWRVTGGPGWNYAAELARGTWLAMLGDDDAFEPHHLECLLETALNTRSEMAYGNTRKVLPPPQPEVVHATYPPQCFEFNCMSAIQMRALSFFEFDVKSWVVEEPSDWNWCRRMIEAGVRIGYVDRVVVNWYSSRDWADE